MSRRNYTILDLTMLTIIACVIEGLLTWASNQEIFLLEGFTVSFVVLFALIGIFRWNYLGVIPGIGAAVTSIIIQNSLVAGSYATSQMTGIILGVICVSLTTLFFKRVDKHKTKDSYASLFLFTALGFIIYIVVNSITWAIMDQVNLIDTLLKVSSRNLLNLVMAYIVLIVASKQRGFLEDMKEYLVYMNTVPSSARIRAEIQEDKEHSITSEIADSDETSDIALLDGGTLSEEQLRNLNKTFNEMEGEKANGTGKSQR